jgi:hypothetical protein
MVFKVIENNPDLIICVQTRGSLKRSETKWVVVPCISSMMNVEDVDVESFDVKMCSK